MQDLLTTAAILTEAAIALFIILGAATMPRRRPSPGQLEIEFTATPELQTSLIPDPWETVPESIAVAAAAPLFPSVPYLLLLPAASVEMEQNWAEMNPQQLRQHCQQQGIKWRNVHGRNKHLSKREMVEALGSAIAV